MEFVEWKSSIDVFHNFFDAIKKPYKSHQILN